MTGLAKVDATDLDGLSSGLKEISASEFEDFQPAAALRIVQRARGRAQGEGRQASSAARTMHAVKAEIRIGGPKAPWAAGSEYGAQQNQRRLRRTGTYRGFKQFKAWRGAGEKAGYWLWPSIRQEAPGTLDLVSDEFDEKTKKAFPK